MIRETSVSATLYDYELNEHSAQQGGTINNDERTETRQGNLPTEQTSHVTWLRITRTNYLYHTMKLHVETHVLQYAKIPQETRCELY